MVKEGKVIYFLKLMEKLREENSRCQYPEYSSSYAKNNGILGRIVDWELVEG